VVALAAFDPRLVHRQRHALWQAVVVTTKHRLSMKDFPFEAALKAMTAITANLIDTRARLDALETLYKAHLQAYHKIDAAETEQMLEKHRARCRQEFALTLEDIAGPGFAALVSEALDRLPGSDACKGNVG
jgi:trans-aconitate methyltransferase